MQYKQLLVSTAGVLTAVVGLAACDTTPREPETAPRMTNDELDRSVTARINSDSALVPYELDVDADADDHAVTISGTVPTQSLRTRAVDAAKSVDATLAITDRIDVKPESVDRKDYNEDMAREARERASTSGESIGASLDDAWIHTKIRSQLVADGVFPGSSLNVDVANNVATLRGTVATAADKTKAEEIARTTEGVKSVRNQLVVKPAS
jgi:hyperosmotically inducible protein